MDLHREDGSRHDLAAADCLVLLAQHDVGRLVTAGTPPRVRPVNFVVVEGRIYVRTETPLIDGAEVAFEVDQVDEAEHQGWSVVVTGPVHAVGPDDVPAEARERLVTWAPGDRRAWSAIDVETISGCWVRAGRLRRGTDGRGYL